MADDKKTDKDRKGGTALKEREKAKVDRPRRWKVVLHNDDFTPMEFVVLVLESVFNHTPAEATRIMLKVHQSGIGVAGVYSLEVAEAKAQKTTTLAREYGYPLLVTTEPE